MAHSKTGFYRKSILQELEFELLGTSDRILTSIYFGGGTPSLAKPKLIQDIIEAITSKFQNCAPEITLEVNPGKITKDKLMDFKSAGINRLSLGIQSLNDEALEFFGRNHRRQDALELVNDAHSIFNNISMDFIWGRPMQTLNDWELELNQIVKLGASHLSLYQLTVEKGTKLHRLAQDGKVIIPDNDQSANLYELTRELTSKSYNQYEISSFSKIGFESKHNTGYWRGYDYIGVGPGAHGRISISDQNYRTQRLTSPSRWSKQIELKGHGRKSMEPILHADYCKELLVFGLRMVQGVDVLEFEKSTGQTIESIINIQELEILEDINMVDIERFGDQLANLRLTYQGLAVSDAILCKILY